MNTSFVKKIPAKKLWPVARSVIIQLGSAKQWLCLGVSGVDPNPYEPPLTSSVRQLERLTLSPLRIPLAILCCVITPLFIATFFGWCGNLLRDGTSSEVGRLAFVYIPLSVVGIAAFGLLAAGLIGKWPRMVGWGLGLFAVGALIQMVVMLAP